MKKKSQRYKATEKLAKKALDTSTKSLGKIGSHAKKVARKLDEEHKIFEHAIELKEVTVKRIKEFDDQHALKEKGKAVGRVVGKAVKDVKKYAGESGVTEKVEHAGDALKRNIVKPVAEWANETGATEKIDDLTNKVIEGYGKTRAAIKPYFEPETSDELLHTTKRELIYINACILQVSRDEAEQLANKLSTAIIAKIAGATSVGTLLGLVSAFGSASTGTAIASLHGAAATNATFYWVGSLLGGGMATGAVLTGGVALAVAYGAYKIIGSEARQFKDLSESEQRIVESTGLLIAAINDVLNDPKKSLTVDEADMLLHNTLIPLHQSLSDNCNEICENLDAKNRTAFRQHAMVDFEKAVIDGFESFINEKNKSRRRYPAYAIAGVIYALLTKSAVDDSRESQRALDAIRRSKVEWNDATEAKLSSDLAQYSPEEMQGLANNVKGIYHEMLFVDDYNNSNSDTKAELFDEPNHPGADVRIRWTETGGVKEEFQLKATGNEGLIKEHFEKYPDIDVLATKEIAFISDLAGSSDISNQVITEKMDGTLADISDNTIVDRTVEGVEIVGLVAAGREAINVLGGKQSVSEAGANVVKAMTVTATSTALVAYLFS